MGLELKSPIVVSSSGLTNSIVKIDKLVKAGVGAVVLKSLFEEQINVDISNSYYQSQSVDYPEAYDYIKEYVKDNDVLDYLNLIKEAKSRFNIPIIASINCYSSGEWVDFAKKVEEAGADAIELNVFILNTDKNSEAGDYEVMYYQISEAVSQAVSIPVALKIGPYFSNLISVVNKLSVLGTKGIVLFNRFYEPDIDVEKMTITAAEVFSTEADIRQTLRWVAILSSKLGNIDISASTGVHSGDAVIKQLLAGASTVQVCSAVYKNGPKIITAMNDRLKQWMENKGFASIASFKGKMNYKNIGQPAVFERAQFMKYFSNLE